MVNGERRVFAPETARRHHTLDADRIEDETPSSLADALRRTHGVSVQQTTPAQTTIYVRGLSGREVAHVVDGVRVNSTLYRAGNVPYLALIDVHALERIDIVPGASSVLYGSDALAGAILMTTYLPGYSFGGARNELRLLQTLSSNPLAATSRAEVVRSDDRYAVRAGVTHTAAGPIRPGEELKSPEAASYVGLEREPADPYRPVLERDQSGTDYRFLGSDFTLRNKLASRLDLITEVQFSVIPELVRYDQVTPRFKNEFPQRAEARLAPLSRTMAAVSLAHRSQSGWYEEAKVLASWQRLSEDVYGRNLDELCLADPPPAEDTSCPARQRLTSSPERSLERNRSDAFGLTGELEVPLVGESHTLRVGSATVFDLVTSETLVEDTATGATSEASPRLPDGSLFTESGLFALFESAFGPSFKAYLGGRGSVFHLHIAQRPVVGGEAPSPGQSLTLFDWAAGAGVVISPIDGLHFDGNVGRGVRAPNVQDLAALGPRAGGRYQLPNPELKPEHSYSGDLGALFAVAKHRLEASLFYLFYTDAIVLAPTSLNGATTSPNGDAYYHSINAASIRMSGLEASGELRVVEPVAVFGRALEILGEQRNPAESGLPERTPADRVAPHQGELGLRFFPSKGIELRPFAAFRKAQNRLNDPVNIDDNRIPEGGTPGFVTYHLHMSHELKRGIVGRLNFENITNELVLEHGGGFYRPGFSVTGSIEAAIL